MADFTQHNQFGSARSAGSTDPQHCARFRTMLADAVDGTLSPEDRSAFDAHLAVCPACTSAFADAQRGAVWLGMLRRHRPEPRADLLGRIFAQTSNQTSNPANLQPSNQPSVQAGNHAGGQASTQTGLQTSFQASLQTSFQASLQTSSQTSTQTSPDARAAAGIPSLTHPVTPLAVGLNQSPDALATTPAGSLTPAGLQGAVRVGADILPFRRRLAAHLRPVGPNLLQPRLAMTAAMAFFSVAVTLNLTGVHITQLRAADLRTSSLKRSFYEADAHVARFYDNLRVVYELESRVHDLGRSAGGDTPESPIAAPAPQTSVRPDAPASPNSPSQHSPGQPSTSQPSQQQPSAAQPGSDPTPDKQPPSRPRPGRSQSEPLLPNRRFFASLHAPAPSPDTPAADLSVPSRPQQERDLA